MSVVLEKVEAAAGYETDLYSWTFDQARLLREGRFGEIDAANIAEEFEMLGRLQYKALKSSYRVLAVHLLKWAHQPERRSDSWIGTICEQRYQIANNIELNPGLKPHQDKAFLDAYDQARKLAATEAGLGLDTFPEEPPFTRGQAEDERFFPE